MKEAEKIDEFIKEYEGMIGVLTRTYKTYGFENYLREHLWKITQNEKVFKKLKSKEELNNYIYIALKNKSIELSKKDKAYTTKFVCVDEYFNNQLGEMDYTLSEIEYEDLTKILKPREKIIIDYKFKYAFSDSEIAKIMNVSRQAIYKAIKKALANIKNNIEKIEI